jgi:LTXXQ motif family protein
MVLHWPSSTCFARIIAEVFAGNEAHLRSAKSKLLADCVADTAVWRRRRLRPRRLASAALPRASKLNRSCPSSQAASIPTPKQFVHNQLAHNQFVAQNFHGLHNFNRTGFNQNAFCDLNKWNHWGGHFWGRGWNRWGHGWGGWAGPVFWPFIYGDIFTFALWPYDYYDPFWSYGLDFLLISIFAPGPYFGADYGYAPDYWYDGGYSGGYGGYAGSPNVYYGGAPTYGGVTQEDRQALAETNAAAEESCNGLAPGVTDFPVERIKQVVQPTSDQLTALNELSAAAAEANKIIKASCPNAVPLTPVARLDTAEAQLEAVIQAADVVRGPLEAFYDSLSDQRKSASARGTVN